MPAYIDLAANLPRVLLETENGRFPMVESNGFWRHEDVFFHFTTENDALKVFLTAENTPVLRVWLAWNADIAGDVRILGDAWERGYGDLEWRGIAPNRPMPWYTLISDKNTTDGYGVMTGPSAMCFWKVDRHSIRLCLDVRNGACGVLLNGRTLHAATVVSRKGNPGETAFEAAKAFCRMMCPNPRLPKNLVYGSNNWYYAYGVSSEEKILTDARLIAELTEGLTPRPYAVIDAGWQAGLDDTLHMDSCAGDAWDHGNVRFPDMVRLANNIKALDLHPGIWVRPLITAKGNMPEYRMPNDNTDRLLDPSHPEVLAYVENMFRTLAGWGYELIKHDFSTVDIFGLWGFEMADELTHGKWAFHDRTKTTAEIILNLYNAIRRGAGDTVVIIGCNTVTHLSAGIFESQRTGDDTSGLEWERTRKMGVNTLAFRMPQNSTFYAADADCVGMTGKVDWNLNREWLKVLAVSGTPLFVSVDPDTVTEEQKADLRKAFATFVNTPAEAVPVDWMETMCPETWETAHGAMTFNFPCKD